VAPAGVRAGVWDDNANFREFQKWLATEEGLGFHRVDVSNRKFLVVRDEDGKAVPRCAVTVTDERQHAVTLTTTTSGHALLFPHAEHFADGMLTATARCNGQSIGARATFGARGEDDVIDLRLATTRRLPKQRTIDVAFILDSTGSMSEEIAAVKSTIRAVAGTLASQGMGLRVGLVEFKDRGEPFVTKVYPMTTDVGRFSHDVAQINAGGGGDTPESVNEGIHVALSDLDWSGDAVGKFAFLVGDAPPHLDYAHDADYAEDMKTAAHLGIQVFTIAASGMDDLGQVVWRQVAQYTGAANYFVLRGGAGPQSTGAGDPLSSCGGTQTRYGSGDLDKLIVSRITQELRALDRDPMKIAGRGQDENAKKCEDRVLARD
jgi:Mg-chelatase subunit ChlD